MQKVLSRLVSGLLSGIISATLLQTAAFAGEPYDVYNYDRYGEAIPSQSGYLAQRAITGVDLGIGNFNAPSDLYKDTEDNFWICDTGNNRIVCVNTEFDTVLTVIDKLTIPDEVISDFTADRITEQYSQTLSAPSEGASNAEKSAYEKKLQSFRSDAETVAATIALTTLTAPKGIYVDPYTDDIYIADNTNSRVIKCDVEGNVSQIFASPNPTLYGTSSFWPQKVLTDKAGNVYVIVTSSTSGAAMFRPDGSFIGFYGANRVQQTASVLKNYAWSFFLTDEQMERRVKTVPSAFTNFDIDEEGFIYTCTESRNQKMDVVKKVNPAGYNIWDNAIGNEYAFGDYVSMYVSSVAYQTQIIDIDIGDNGLINCLDLTTGRVFQYDSECHLLFIVGTKAKQLGGFELVSAVESLGTNLYVLDSAKLSVTIFTTTVFGDIVHSATQLYNDGYYEEALDPWLEVLKRDGNYRRAHVGLANAYYNKGDYELAMKYANNAMSGYLYNKAFEGYRSEFIRDNLTVICVVLILIIIAISVFKQLLKRGIIKLPKIDLKTFKLPKKGVKKL